MAGRSLQGWVQPFTNLNCDLSCTLTSPGQTLEKQGMAFEKPSHLHEKRNQKFSSHPLCCWVILSLVRLLFTLVISNTLSFLIRHLHICFTCKYSYGNFCFAKKKPKPLKWLLHPSERNMVKQQESKELRFKIHFYKSSFKPWVRYKNLMLKL